MPRFVSFDPHVFDDPRVVAHHEASHALLAYYFGFRIGRFRTIQLPGGLMTGSVQNRPNVAMHHDDRRGSLVAKVRQLLAGEIAARMYANLRIDELVLPLPGAENVDQRTPWQLVHGNIQMNPPRDTAKASEIIQDLAIAGWWQWLWMQHTETHQILQRYWVPLRQLADLFYFALTTSDRCVGLSPLKLLSWAPSRLRPDYWPRGTSLVTGRRIIRHLYKSRMHVFDRRYTPTSSGLSDPPAWSV